MNIQDSIQISIQSNPVVTLRVCRDLHRTAINLTKPPQRFMSQIGFIAGLKLSHTWCSPSVYICLQILWIIARKQQFTGRGFLLWMKGGWSSMELACSRGLINRCKIFGFALAVVLIYILDCSPLAFVIIIKIFVSKWWTYIHWKSEPWTFQNAKKKKKHRK